MIPRIVICGMRHLADAHAHLEDAWATSPWGASEHVLVLHGGVSTLDRAVERFADRRGFSATVLPIKADSQASADDLPRQAHMMDVCDGVIAIWDGLCMETRRLIAEATGLGKRVHVHRISVAPVA